MVIQAEGNRFFVLSPTSYSTESNVDVLSRKGPGGSTIERVLTWAPVGKDVVAFASVRTPKGEDDDVSNDGWSSGIVRFSLDAKRGKNSGFQFVGSKDLPINNTSRVYHRLGFSYIAALGNSAYVLLMENGAFGLWKNEEGNKLEPMEALNDENKWLPLSESLSTLASFRANEDSVSVMKAVEEASMPIGLYASIHEGEGFLYLLSRRPKDGKTQWLLSKIDPKQDQVVSTVVIRSRANHLFAIPGSQEGNWTFVEKGPLLGLKEQKVYGILTIPTTSMLKAFDRAAEKRDGGGLLDICK
jgi:hypothetical protein